MKSCLIIFICASIFFNSITISQITPKGQNLKNHYGTNPVENRFGPNAVIGVHLMREGVVPGSKITPITNFDREIAVHSVVAGDLTNTAVDASKIVRPSIACKFNLYNNNIL
jgi:hypothetical protein